MYVVFLIIGSLMILSTVIYSIFKRKISKLCVITFLIGVVLAVTNFLLLQGVLSGKVMLPLIK